MGAGGRDCIKTICTRLQQYAHIKTHVPARGLGSTCWVSGVLSSSSTPPTASPSATEPTLITSRSVSESLPSLRASASGRVHILLYRSLLSHWIEHRSIKVVPGLFTRTIGVTAFWLCWRGCRINKGVSSCISWSMATLAS